jgi:hypothetical protein
MSRHRAEIVGRTHPVRSGEHNVPICRPLEQLKAQADSSLRLLRRRADRIARPARVRIRRRKPWVFARRRLFGWKVRLLTVSLHHIRSWPASRDDPAHRWQLARFSTGSATAADRRFDGPQEAHTKPQRYGSNPGLVKPVVTLSVRPGHPSDAREKTIRDTPGSSADRGRILRPGIVSMRLTLLRCRLDSTRAAGSPLRIPMADETARPNQTWSSSTSPQPVDNSVDESVG